MREILHILPDNRLVRVDISSEVKKLSLPEVVRARELLNMSPETSDDEVHNALALICKRNSKKRMPGYETFEATVKTVLHGGLLMTGEVNVLRAKLNLPASADEDAVREAIFAEIKSSGKRYQEDTFRLTVNTILDRERGDVSDSEERIAL